MSGPKTSLEDRRRFEGFRAQGRWDQAESAAREVLARHPGDAVFLSLRHQALALLGRYAEAFEDGERFVDAEPASFDLKMFWDPALLPPVFAHRAQRLAALDALIARRPNAPWAFYYRAVMSPGKEGIPFLAKAAAFPAKRYGWMHAMLGRIRLSFCHYAEAIAHFEIAAKSRPFDWKARAFLGESRLCAGDRAGAFAQIERARTDALDEGDALQAASWKGEMLLWVGDYPAALRLLRESCRQNSPFAPCWLGAALLKAGRRSEALAQLEAAEKTYPDPEIWIWRGEALREAGKLLPALDALSRDARGLWPRVNRALLFAALKDEDRMKAEFWGIPGHVREYLLSKTGRPADRPLSPKDMRELLAAALTLARGYRREDSYGNAIWMS